MKLKNILRKLDGYLFIENRIISRSTQIVKFMPQFYEKFYIVIENFFSQSFLPAPTTE